MKADYFGKDASPLKEKRLFILDMDGTIYEENRLFSGTIELLHTIKRQGGKYIFVTNNSSRSVKDYVDKVNAMGIVACRDDFFTSVDATALYLNQHFEGMKVYVQCTDSMLCELVEQGIDVTTEVSDEAKVILVGFDTEITARKITNTCIMLQKGLPYIATNPDLACPVSFGFIPDCGSMCQAYENATGKRPFYIGKPRRVMVDLIREKYGFTREETCVIGDRLYTDIAVGINAGVDTLCVLTGEATPDDIEKMDQKPSYTFKSVKEIYEVLL